MSESLLSDVRNYLGITWDDIPLDQKLTGIISRGMEYINRKAGRAFDYTVDDTPRQLLFDYVRYVHAQIFELYEKDLRQEFISLINAIENGYYGEDPDG
jgi:hypothetical protein